MDISIDNESKTKIDVSLRSEGHTFTNLIRKELWTDKKVNVATYTYDHPLVGHPVLHVEVQNGSVAKTALTDAAKRVKKQADDLQKLASKKMKI